MKELHREFENTIYHYLGGVAGVEYLADRYGMVDQLQAYMHGYEVI